MRSLNNCLLPLFTALALVQLSTVPFAAINTTISWQKSQPVAAAFRLLSALLPTPLPLSTFNDHQNALGTIVYGVVSDLQHGTAISNERVKAIVDIMGEWSDEQDRRGRSVWAFETLQESLASVLASVMPDMETVKGNDAIMADLGKTYPACTVLPTLQRKPATDHPSYLTAVRIAYSKVQVKSVIPVDGKRYRLKAMIGQPLKGTDELLMFEVDASADSAAIKTLDRFSTTTIIHDSDHVYPFVMVYELDKRFLKPAGTVTPRTPPMMIRYLPDLGEHEPLRGLLSALAVSLVDLPDQSESALVTVLKQMRARQPVDMELVKSMGEAVRSQSAPSMELLLGLLPKAFFEQNVSTFTVSTDKECGLCETQRVEPPKRSMLFSVPDSSPHHNLSDTLQHHLQCVKESTKLDLCTDCEATTTTMQADTFCCDLKRYLFLSVTTGTAPTDDLQFCNASFAKLVAFVDCDDDGQVEACVRLGGDGNRWIKIGDRKMLLVKSDGSVSCSYGGVKRLLIYRRD